MPRKPKHFANKRVTLYDIAKSAGVSPMTVSLAMRNQPEVKEKTKLHVQNVARKMGYRPQAAASILAGGRTHSVGLVFAQTGGADFEIAMAQSSPTIHTIGDLLTKRDYITSITTWYQPNLTGLVQGPNVPMPRVFRESGIEGVIVIYPLLDGSLEQMLQKMAIPYVVIDAAPAPGRLAVYVDERKGVELTVEHLVTLGHRRIAFIGGQISYAPLIYSTIRVPGYQQGYISAMHKAGLPLMPGHEQHIREKNNIDTSDFSEDFSDHIKRLFELPSPPTAIMAYDHHSALELICYLMERGLKVPQDISVVSLIDQLEVNYTLGYTPIIPTITAKNPMHEQLATAAVDKLMGMIDANELIDPDHTPEPIVIEPHIIARDSTGPPS